MKIVGLITEYNPFHNGHKYHIEEAKRVTGADYVIAVMSGDFVQRGTPALIDKYTRAEMALLNGVDLVLELPVCYATGSAEYFAHGAVSLLDKLGIVDYLCFGSECGDIGLLMKTARFLTAPPSVYEESLQALLKDGLTYPAARLKALQQVVTMADESEDGQALSDIMLEPNNILGIEYLKALLYLNSSMEPVTILRKSAHYHDGRLAESDPDEAVSCQDASKGQLRSIPIISSATAIRKAIHSNKEEVSRNFDEIRKSVPESVFTLLTANHLKSYPIMEEDFSSILKYKLLSENSSILSGYMDISDDLADRIMNISGSYLSFNELAAKIKTKNVTLTRINRALIHILLNIKAENVKEYSSNGYTQYAKILGIKKESSQLLRKIEKADGIPIITKVAKAEEQLDILGMRMLQEDIFAAHLYNQVVYEKFKFQLPNEYKHGICII